MPKLVIVFVCVLASSTVLAAPAADEWTELNAKHQRIHHQAELLAAIQTA